MTNLRSQFLKGVKVTFLTKYGGVFLRIGFSAVLARILSPAEFGVVAVTTVFTNFFDLLSQMGIGPTIVQTKDLDDDDISTFFILTVILSVVFGGLFYICAYPIAVFYQNDVYIQLIKILTISLCLNILRIVPAAVLQKNKKFLILGLVEIGLIVISSIIAIIMALQGFSFFSIVYGSIGATMMSFIIFYVTSGVRARCVFKALTIRRTFHYSFFQFMFSVTNYFARNLDNLLIGKFFGPAGLGIYDRSYNLMLYPVRNLTFVLNPVMHPILSEHQHDPQTIFRAYCKIVRVLALIGIPISIFCYFSTSEIILTIYGSQWEPAIPIFKILSSAVWIQVILSSSGSIFQSSGNTRLMFFSSIFSTFVLVLGIVLGLHYGLKGVALGVSGAFYIIFVPNYYLLIKFALKCSFLNFMSIFLKPLQIGLILIIGMFALVQFLINAPLFVSLIAKIVFLVGLYILGLRWTGEIKSFQTIKF